MLYSGPISRSMISRLNRRKSRGGPSIWVKLHWAPGLLLKPIQDSRTRFTDAQATALKAGTSAIYVKGQASYIDAFNEPRVTEFIYVSGGGQPVGSGMRPYREGNKAT
jgi:hypothetical protein